MYVKIDRVTLQLEIIWFPSTTLVLYCRCFVNASVDVVGPLSLSVWGLPFMRYEYLGGKLVNISQTISNTLPFLRKYYEIMKKIGGLTDNGIKD